ncbi:MAG: type II toxin-antitoxin system VapB family antitoxin [Candidatus Competibacter denitrificans]
MNRKPQRSMQVTVDSELVEEGLQTTGLKTRRDLVNFALRELLRRENQKKLLELKGQVEWEGDLSVLRGSVPHDLG